MSTEPNHDTRFNDCTTSCAFIAPCASAQPRIHNPEGTSIMPITLRATRARVGIALASGGLLALAMAAAVAPPADAATTSCGRFCTDVFSPAFGAAGPPSFVLEVPHASGQVGDPVTVARASGTNQQEDFLEDESGTVHDFVEAGLMSSGLDALYGNLEVDEFEYAPHGTGSANCMGVADTRRFGTRVTLQPCGVSAKTLWIVDPETTKTGSYDALINGATNSNFQHPSSLTTLLPYLPLFTVPLEPSLPPALFTHQLWGQFQGALP